jgi:hypothetical protein
MVARETKKEQGFTSGHKNVNCVQVREAKGYYDASTVESKTYITSKPPRELKREDNTSGHQNISQDNNNSPEPTTQRRNQAASIPTKDERSFHTTRLRLHKGERKHTRAHAPSTYRESKTKLTPPGKHRSPDVVAHPDIAAPPEDQRSPPLSQIS